MTVVESIKSALLTAKSGTVVYVRILYIDEVLEVVSTALAYDRDNRKVQWTDAVLMPGNASTSARVIFKVWLQDAPCTSCIPAIIAAENAAEDAFHKVARWYVNNPYVIGDRKEIYPTYGNPSSFRPEGYAGNVAYVGDKIDVIKEVRRVTTWGLKESKDWVDAYIERLTT